MCRPRATSQLNGGPEWFTSTYRSGVASSTGTSGGCTEAAWVETWAGAGADADAAVSSEAGNCEGEDSAAGLVALSRLKTVLRRLTYLARPAGRGRGSVLAWVGPEPGGLSAMVLVCGGGGSSERPRVQTSSRQQQRSYCARRDERLYHVSSRRRAGDGDNGNGNGNGRRTGQQWERLWAWPWQQSALCMNLTARAHSAGIKLDPGRPGTGVPHGRVWREIRCPVAGVQRAACSVQRAGSCSPSVYPCAHGHGHWQALRQARERPVWQPVPSPRPPLQLPSRLDRSVCCGAAFPHSPPCLETASRPPAASLYTPTPTYSGHLINAVLLHTFCCTLYPTPPRNPHRPSPGMRPAAPTRTHPKSMAAGSHLNVAGVPENLVNVEPRLACSRRPRCLIRHNLPFSLPDPRHSDPASSRFCSVRPCLTCCSTLAKQNNPAVTCQCDVWPNSSTSVPSHPQTRRDYGCVGIPKRTVV